MSLISVVGSGYVGLSNAVLLAQKHEVRVLDISFERVSLLNSGKSTVADGLLQDYLTRMGGIVASTDPREVLVDSDWVIIATPTDYDVSTNCFDTTSVEMVIDQVMTYAPSAKIVIRSTIPVGFVEKMRQEKDFSKIIFSPEFLREGSALHDSLYPSRIIVGDKNDFAYDFAKILSDVALADNTPILLTSPTEAEAIKLFANTYLAMRVSFFNELDTYAIYKDLDSREIIEGVCLDPRIGDYYNNPSFGYGGYCLPKDSKQLLANYSGVPNNIITAIVESNETRKDVITQDILSKSPSSVGVYRLVMKSGSDNFRESSIQGIMKRLCASDVELLVYEPSLDVQTFEGAKCIVDLEEFKSQSDIIITNRLHSDLDDVKEKIYSRDLFGLD